MCPMCQKIATAFRISLASLGSRFSFSSRLISSSSAEVARAAFVGLNLSLDDSLAKRLGANVEHRREGISSHPDGAIVTESIELHSHGAVVNLLSVFLGHERTVSKKENATLVVRR